MKLLLAITGSVSAYKSIDLARELVKEGHDVRVITTRGAEEFINPKLFHYLGVQEVYRFQDDFEKSKFPENVLHIELTKWCDRMLVCPASANTLFKLANGACDDLLSSVFLAMPENKTVIIAPAMNPNMFEKSQVQKNIETIHQMPNCHIYQPASGTMACGDTGIGKLPPVEELLINLTTLNIKLEKQPVEKNIVIATGATISPLDDVRYLTNSSSGKTGMELALEFHQLGYRIKLIAGHYATSAIDYLSKLPLVEIFRVKTTLEMRDQVHLSIDDSTELYLSPAAISDIGFKTGTGKLKKKDLDDHLEIEALPDVLKSVIEKYPKLAVVGFAAETDLSHEMLKEKYKRKPTKLLVGTRVSSGLIKKEQAGFSTESAYYLIYKDGTPFFEGELSKKKLARLLSEQINEEEHSSHPEHRTTH